MSGPLGSSQWMYNAGGDFYPTTIDNSLRFNGSNSTLTKAVSHNRKTFTVSFWTKRSNVDRRMIYGAYNNSANTSVIAIDTNGLTYYNYVNAYTAHLRTNALFRDVSAWYHIVLAVDTTQSTSSNRLKLYVNGEQVTSFLYEVYPSQNADMIFGSGITHAVGTEGTNTRLVWDGYLADYCLIDGTALGPDSFGEFKSGIWVAKDVSGLTFGSGGYYLKFDGNANDSSGNSNNWTANNISAHDYMPDTPTNNFNTLNGVAKSAGLTLSEGNLKTNNSNDFALGTISVSSGKWYFEHYVNSSNGGFIGIWETEGVFSTAVDDSGNNTDGYGYYTSGQKVRNGSYQSYGSSFTTGDIVGCAFDLDNGKVYFSKNGTFQNSGDPAAGTNAAYTGLTGAFVTKTGHFNSNSPTVANFGQDSTFAGATTAGGNADDSGYGDFAYAPPTDFLAMCSANMPELAIDPANDDTSDDNFNTVLWTGNGTSQSITVGFQADFIWAKDRSATAIHILSDAIRGPLVHLSSHDSTAEAADDAVRSFDTDGFTSGNWINTSSNAFVSWNWKAGGTAVSNTDGSITSSVSANPTAGFSIVNYVGTGTNDSYGHGLGVAPKMIITKDRTDPANWAVYVASLGTGKYLQLNLDVAAITNSVIYPTVTSTTIGVGVQGDGSITNTSGDNYISYCFADVEGHQKIGSFVGNSGEYPFVNLGFKPAFILFKNQQTGAYWAMHDNTRNPHNVADKYLFANLTNAEATQYSKVDLLSNGFKMRSVNGNVNYDGSTTYFLAIAEQPFKYANAR